MRFITRLMIVLSLLSLGATAQASSSRTVDADNIQYSDHSKSFQVAPKIISVGAGTTIDWDLATSLTNNTYTVDLAANTTFTFSNVTLGQTINVDLLNTASNYTVTWPSTSGGFTIYWSGGTAPVQTTGVKADTCTFIAVRSNAIRASCVQNF